jgi:hypothetical protein
LKKINKGIDWPFKIFFNYEYLRTDQLP